MSPISDLAIVGATLLGPVLAVQAQKWVERARERHHRKEWIFHTLMANRQKRLSADFERALNMIDLAFYGQRIFGRSRRKKAEQRVIDAWREYHTTLSDPTIRGANQDMVNRWSARVDEQVINLLHAVANDLKYDFDREIFRSGGYSTSASVEHENDIVTIRRAVVAMTQGKAAVPVVIYPPEPEIGVLPQPIEGAH